MTSRMCRVRSPGLMGATKLPGHYTPSLEHPAGPCYRSSGSWPAEGANQLVIEVVPGFINAPLGFRYDAGTIHWTSTPAMP